MSKLKIVIWAKLEDLKTRNIVEKDIYYIYEVKKEVLQQMLTFNYYKSHPFFLPLDRYFYSEFKLIETNETKQDKNSKVIDTDSRAVYVDDKLIYNKKGE